MLTYASKSLAVKYRFCLGKYNDEFLKFGLVIGCRDVPPGAGGSHMELHATGPHSGKISQ